MDYILFNLLSALGFRRFAYRNIYLRSKHWKDYAKNKRKSHYLTCERCGNPGYDVHHMTYENLWHEKPYDTMLLCRRCHKTIHSL